MILIFAASVGRMCMDNIGFILDGEVPAQRTHSFTLCIHSSDHPWMRTRNNIIYLWRIQISFLHANLYIWSYEYILPFVSTGGYLCLVEEKTTIFCVFLLTWLNLNLLLPQFLIWSFKMAVVQVTMLYATHNQAANNCFTGIILSKGCLREFTALKTETFVRFIKAVIQLSIIVSLGSHITTFTNKLAPLGGRTRRVGCVYNYRY